MPASAMVRPSPRFIIIPATFSVSTTTRPRDLAIAVVALWWWSLRTLATRAWNWRRLAYSRSLRLEWLLFPWTFRPRAIALSMRRSLFSLTVDIGCIALLAGMATLIVGAATLVAGFLIPGMTLLIIIGGAIAMLGLLVTGATALSTLF